MNTHTLRVQLLHFNPINLRNPTTNTSKIIPVKTRCRLINPSSKSSKNIGKYPNRSSGDTIVELASSLKDEKSCSSGIWKEEKSRMVMLGVISVGIAGILMDENSKAAMALGPEGPLVEEFWDNMRRYGLYALTVSTGAIWALVEPIYELLKNPISALLVVIILGGGFFIVTQVVTAMVGLSDFSYQYQ